VCARPGADARPWLPELLHLLRTEDSPAELMPGRLAPVLAGLAAADPEVLGLLREALGGPEPARANAASALAEMDGGGARAYIPG
jgi:hypothetical protein